MSEDGTVQLMVEESGDVFEQVTLPEGKLGESIRKAYEATEDTIRVQVAAVPKDRKEMRIVKLVAK
jgi:hypothetical protein